MQIYIFKSETRKGLHAFAGDLMGANFGRIMVRGPLPGWSDRICLLPITSHVMRSKKQSMLKGFSSGGLAAEQNGGSLA
jgi:hypothetical protein